jgi:threonyl-tRNA synthetase
MFNKLTNFLRAQYEQFGFQEVITPTIYKKSLWEKSGHWQNYADDMYAVTGRGASGEKEGRQIGEDEEYGLKPMNCPGHCLIFASKLRTYRDLPIRYADFSPLHRNEVHGALSGLTRVRRFHQDDGHIFCRPSQIVQEISRTLDFVRMTYAVLGLGPYRLALSTRPKDKFIGSVEEWDNAEAGLKLSLKASGQKWTINEGDGAFYGPKIDIILKDANGKEHQTATIQLDFQLPKRFGLEYQAPAPAFEQKGLTTDEPELLAVQGPVTPVMIHRAVLGSVERLMALLIEHYNGLWPFWLNPRQVVILTLKDSEEVLAAADKAKEAITGIDENFRTNEGAVFPGERISVDIDSSAIPLGKKIAAAKKKRYAVIAIVGDRDLKWNRVIVDFSGIPDPSQRLATNALLKKIAALARTAGIQAGEVIRTYEERLAVQNVDELPDLTPEELRTFSIQPKYLKMVLEGLQMNHF